jgi:hypothetical protein
MWGKDLPQEGVVGRRVLGGKLLQEKSIPESVLLQQVFFPWRASAGFCGITAGPYAQPTAGGHWPNTLVPIWTSADDTILRTSHPVMFPFNCSANQNPNQR